jgi:hypothetical protein
MKYSYSILYTRETSRDNAKFETVILMKTDTVLMGDYHIKFVEGISAKLSGVSSYQIVAEGLGGPRR